MTAGGKERDAEARPREAGTTFSANPISDKIWCNFADLSDGARALTVDRCPGDLGTLFELKNGERAKSPGLIGDVAVGRKKGSTTGFVTAV